MKKSTKVVIVTALAGAGIAYGAYRLWKAGKYPYLGPPVVPAGYMGPGYYSAQSGYGGPYYIPSAGVYSDYVIPLTYIGQNYPASSTGTGNVIT